MLKENSGRFLIEEITSENEEEFVYNITGKIQEIDFFDNIQLSIPSNIQKSLRKFICDENINLNDKGFKCEILNINLRKFEDFDEVWNSFYNNHMDEFNLIDFNFNIQKENEFIKINDFYKTQSDFKRCITDSKFLTIPFGTCISILKFKLFKIFFKLLFN